MNKITSEEKHHLMLVLNGILQDVDEAERKGTGLSDIVLAGIDELHRLLEEFVHFESEVAS